MPELITNPQELARQLLLATRAIAAQVPGYLFLPVAERRRLGLQANVPVAFLTSAAAALDASPALAAALGDAGGRIRYAVDLRNSFLPVSDELLMVGRGVRHTITVTLSDAATLAQQVYSMSKTFNRTADREVLIPHIENMRRNLEKRTGSASPQPEPTPPTTPEPPANGGQGSPKK